MGFLYHFLMGPVPGLPSTSNVNSRKCCIKFPFCPCTNKNSRTLLRGEKLNYKSRSVAKEISKPPFLDPEVQWASKFTVFVQFTFPLNVSNHVHIWYVT